MADAMFSSSFQFGDVQGAGYGRVVTAEEDEQNTWFQTDQGKGSDECSASDSRNKTTRRMSKDVLSKSQILEIGKPMKEKPYSFSLASLELLSSYGKVLKKAMDENGSRSDSSSPNTPGQKLSLEEIMRVAGERYIQFSIQKVDGLSMFIHPYSSELAELSVEETADVELVQHLLAAAECISRGQFNVASGLLTRCHWVANDEGNPVQRIVFHFAEALTQRIEIETGITSPERILERAAYQRRLAVDFNVSFLACHREVPFNQAFQFAAVQAVVENVKTTRKIHVIDLHIRSGIQWTILMQALAEREDNPVLKISALEFEPANKQHLEDTGKRLQSFAESMNIPFSFGIISVSDMKELKEELFKKEPDEVVAVYSPFILRTMISTPDRMGSLIRAIRKLRPSVFVVIEVEANHNSPTFVSRFIESLFFYSAFFDCLEDCMERDSPHRKTIETVYLGEGIRNMVGTEGDQRCTRNVKLDVWRAFFSRYGMTELQLSESSLCQADMILKKFPKASSCNLINDGKGVVVAWKGTPIQSLTTWKFLVEQFCILPPDEDEAIVVYASMVLRTIITNPVHVETVMKVLKNLNPTVMVVSEVEANHNSPCFINRFVDALFYYATLFDCLEDSLERGNRNRTAIETIAFREGIRNIVATERRERTTRSLKIDVWRSFFAKFGMAEIPLSQSCLYQANLILKNFHCDGSSCTLEMNGGGCILLGWKGTPVHSISSWKFQ